MAHTHQLPELPYSLDALEPYISKETLEYHYGKHHASYIKKLNKEVENTDYADKSLEQIITTAQGSIFNNAAQAWNHTFYWQCLGPASDKGENESSKNEVQQAIEHHFKTLDDFKKKFSKAATSLFGSGWTWLVVNQDGNLEIVKTQNADTPLRQGQNPLLTCDVWEHAYYLDYQNARKDYLQAFWKLVNWDFVNEQYEMATEASSAHAINQ